MSIDFQSLCVDPVFGVLGVLASLEDPRNVGVLIDLTVIDANISDTIGDIAVATTRPALCVRQAELQALGLTDEIMIDARINYLGKRYRIRDAKPQPVPGVGLNGLVHLVIVES
jgi:hypothetical protein